MFYFTAKHFFQPKMENNKMKKDLAANEIYKIENKKIK